jgi:hypothetical protein
MSALGRGRRAGTAGPPTWWASRAVRSASLALPSEHRYRYRQEFLAELYGMTPAEQLHHATGVLSRIWTLRVTLTEPARLLPKEATMAKPWRCRIRLHRYQRLRNPEGGWYRECRDCGQQRNVMGGPPSMAGPSAGGY